MRRAYSTLALGLLAAGASMPGLGLLLLAPDVGATLGMKGSGVASLVLAQSLAVVVGILVMAQVAHRFGRRALLAVLAAAVAAASGLSATLAGTSWGLFGLLTLAALGPAAALALHPPLLVGARAIAGHRALIALGTAAAAGAVAALAADLTWRGITLVLGAAAVASLPLSIGVRETNVPGTDFSLGEIARGVVRAAGVRRLLAAHAALGVLTVPLAYFLLLFLEDRWSLELAPRAGVLAGAAVAAAVLTALLARDGERLLGEGPDRLLRAAAIVLALAALALAAGVVVPAFGVSVALLCAAVAGVTAAQAAMTATLMATVEPQARLAAASLAGAATVGIGGVLGLLVTVGVAQEVGAGAALVALALPGSAAALALRSAAEGAPADLAAMRARAAEELAVRTEREAGVVAPLLACHTLVVRYGHRRAIDGVDLAVQEGELLALLGTNGAGKSTLLRALSGLTAPDSGSVRLEGRDITLLDTERRFALGIGHVAAGDAVFSTLRVHESLRLAAHAAGLRRRDATDAVAWAYERFPRLQERRHSRVGALSGGERQMLALSQMLLRPPRILLADELSLGLAPAVVRDLLDVVREIHAEGTTVVVVEQSVDRALEIATRAVFLERGRVRFDGPPAELLARDDLLRPVFLAGSRA